MAQSERTQRVSEEIDTGGVLDRQYRSVQDRGSGTSVHVNLTNFGRRLHGLEAGDSVSVVVCDKGIWISTDE